MCHWLWLDKVKQKYSSLGFWCAKSPRDSCYVKQTSVISAINTITKSCCNFTRSMYKLCNNKQQAYSLHRSIFLLLVHKFVTWLEVYLKIVAVIWYLDIIHDRSSYDILLIDHITLPSSQLNFTSCHPIYCLIFLALKGKYVCAKVNVPRAYSLNALMCARLCMLFLLSRENTESQKVASQSHLLILLTTIQPIYFLLVVNSSKVPHKTRCNCVLRRPTPALICTPTPLLLEFWTDYCLFKLYKYILGDCSWFGKERRKSITTFLAFSHLFAKNIQYWYKKKILVKFLERHPWMFL